MRTALIACWAGLLLSALAAAAPPASAPAEGTLKLSSIDPLQSVFNPSAGETATVRFSLSRPAHVTLVVWGPNQELIARPALQKPLDAGLNQVTWDGRDVDGQLVPDEAYSFEIQAVSGDQAEVYDPLLTSGGDRVIAGDLQNLEGPRFAYDLPRACRVLVRAAVQEGPLVRTLVNWEPRPGGLSVEQWDGMDSERVRSARDIPRLHFGVMAFALPDKVIITTGNRAQNYRQYFSRAAKLRQHKEKVIRRQDANTIISPHWLLPAHLNKDPQVRMEFVGAERPAASQPATAPASRPAASAPAVLPAVRLTGSSALVRVDMPDEDDRTFMNNQKFELIIYIDDKRVLELEQGHVPFNYPWDISALAPGRYLLTVNVSSFRNHVGTTSRYVEIAR